MNANRRRLAWAALTLGVACAAAPAVHAQQVVMRPRASTTRADAGEIDASCFPDVDIACFMSLRYKFLPTPRTELPFITAPANVADDAPQPFPFDPELLTSAVIKVDALGTSRMDPGGALLATINESTPCNIIGTWGGFQAVLGFGNIDFSNAFSAFVAVNIAANNADAMTPITDCTPIPGPPTPSMTNNGEWVIEVLINTNPGTTGTDDHAINDQDVMSGAVVLVADATVGPVIMGTPIQVISTSFSGLIPAGFDPAKDLWVRVRGLSNGPEDDPSALLSISDIRFLTTFTLDSSGPLNIDSGPMITAASYKTELIATNDASTDARMCTPAAPDGCSTLYVTASGTLPPYTWSVVDGSLPPGLTAETADMAGAGVSSGGCPTLECQRRLELTGTPTVDAVGQNFFTLKVEDGVVPDSDTEVIVHNVDGLRLLPRELPTFQVGVPVNINFTAVSSYVNNPLLAPTSGACTNWMWSLGGSIPPGMIPGFVVDASNCFATLTGTPTEVSGAFTVTVQDGQVGLAGHLPAYTDAVTYSVSPMRIIGGAATIPDVPQGMYYYAPSNVTGDGITGLTVGVTALTLATGDGAVVAPGMTLKSAASAERIRVDVVAGDTLTIRRGEDVIPVGSGATTHDLLARYEVLRGGEATTNPGACAPPCPSVPITMALGHGANFFRGAKIRDITNDSLETMSVADIVGDVLTVVRDVDGTGGETHPLGGTGTTAYYEVVEAPLAVVPVGGRSSTATRFVWQKTPNLDLSQVFPANPAAPPTLIALPPDTLGLGGTNSELFLLPRPVLQSADLTDVVDSTAAIVTRFTDPTDGTTLVSVPIDLGLPADVNFTGDHKLALRVTDVRVSPEVSVFDDAMFPFRILPRRALLLGRYPAVTSDRVLTFSVFGAGGLPTSADGAGADETRNLTGAVHYGLLAPSPQLGLQLQIDTWDDAGVPVLGWFGPADFGPTVWPLVTAPLSVSVDMTNAVGISIDGGGVVATSNPNLMPGAQNVQSRRYRFIFSVPDAIQRGVDGLAGPNPDSASVDILVDEGEGAGRGVRSRQKVFGR